MKFIKNLLLLLLLITTSFAHAASESDANQLLSLNGGIASPAGTTGLRENPAGLIYNSSLTLEFSAETNDSDLDPLGLGAHLFLGNGSVAAGVGISKSTASNSSATVDFGLAAHADSIDTTVGAAAGFETDDGRGSGSGVGGVNIGALFNSSGKTRFGLTVFDVASSGPRSIGAGVMTDLNGSAIIGLDASTNTELDGFTLMPGIGIAIQQIQMNMGYGIEVDEGASNHLGEGFRAGLGFSAGQSVHISAYYEHFSKFFLGVAFML